jgi:hypothetical protein
LREWVDRNVNGPFEFIVIRLGKLDNSADGAPGWPFNGAPIAGIDLIVAAGLDRNSGGLDLLEFLQIVLFEKVRTIAVDDSVDSGKPNWLLAATHAALRHDPRLAYTVWP